MTGIIKIILFILLFVVNNFCQDTTYSQFGRTYRFNSNYTSFPHSEREKGYTYKGDFYSAKDHYSDNSVLIFIPKHFIALDSVSLTFYFHGWHNNIDKSIRNFDLISQFFKSKVNGILIFAETAKDAPDSFGGKLEEDNVFSFLVEDVVQKLDSLFSNDFKIGNITLAGHSGAYRVIAKILRNGGITDHIKNVILFDALYAENDIYLSWLTEYQGKFINIFTPDGGTKSMSLNLMDSLHVQKMELNYILNDNFSSVELKKHRIIFISSELGHSDVIHTKDQFMKFLESSL